MPRAPFGNQELYQAILDGDLATLKKLHQNGVDFNVNDSMYGTLLGMAVSVLIPDVVDFLLEHGADPNLMLRNHDSTLNAAILHKEVRMVKSLLAHGANPSAISSVGVSPLIGAITSNSFEIIKLLIDAGADVLAKNKFGVNALQASELNTSKKIRDYLVSKAKVKPASLDPFQAAQLGEVQVLKDWLSKKPAAREAARAAVAAVAAGQVDAVKLFLTNGLDPNTSVKLDEKNVNWPQEPLIFWAVHEGHAPVVQALIDAGARIDLLNQQKGTPLLAAVSEKHASVVKVLLDAGPDPLHQDKLGNSPLSVARQCDFKQIAKLLDKAVAGKPPQSASLLEAVQNGMLDQVKQFLDTGADLEATNSQGLTSLQQSIALGNLELVNLLVFHGAKAQPAGPICTWEKALHHNAKPEIVKALIDAGLDANAQMKRAQMTPLQYAAVYCHKNVEQILDIMINGGADPNVTYTQQIPPEMQKSYQALKDLGSGLAKAFGGTFTLPEWAGRCGNRKAAAYLKTRLGIALDDYDLALQQAKLLTDALAQPAMQALVTDLSKTLHAKPLPWKRRKGVVSFRTKLMPLLKEKHLGIESTGDLLRNLATQVKAQGAQLVYSRLVEGSESRTELLFFPTNNPYVVIAASGTNGVNHGFECRDVVKWFTETAKTHSFTIIGCSFDFIDVHFQTPMNNAAGLLQSMVQFCPDIEERDDQAVAELARTGDCFFWWD